MRRWTRRIAQFTLILFTVIKPHVGDVLHEQHHEDVVLVLGWVDCPTKVSHAFREWR